MLKSLNKKYPFNDNLKINVRSILAVSLGIFLFLLFFEPFNIQNPDFNNRLIILATFGAITLVLLSIFRLVIPSIFSRAFSEGHWNVIREIIIDLLFVIFNTVAFAFFARFVGQIPITFHIAIIIVIISIAAISVLVVINRIYLLKLQVERLKTVDFESNTATSEKKEITFTSDNKGEYFQLPVHQLLFLKSAGNYVEIVYRSDEKNHTKLIRNTLKSLEQLLSVYPEMIRCHRSYMVNKNHIKSLKRDADGLVISLNNYPKEIHVSRQYALKVKEVIQA